MRVSLPLPWMIAGGLLAAALAALAGLPYFPSLDGPEHVYTAGVLAELVKHPDGWWSDWFALDARPWPNWFCQVVLALLVQLVSGPAAEKLLVGGYAVALMGAWWWLLRTIGVRSAWPVCLILPFVFNHFVFLGFYNFVWSLPLYFLATGLAWKSLRDGAKSGWKLALLLVLLYFTHPLALVEWGLAVGVFAVFSGFRTGAGPACVRERLMWPALAALPAFALSLWYLSRPSGGGLWVPGNPVASLAALLRLDFLVPLHGPVMLAPLLLGASVLAAFLVQGVLHRNRPARGVGTWLALAAVQAVVALAAPEQIGVGSIIPYRLSLFAWLSVMTAVALAWEGTGGHGGRDLRGFLGILAAGVFVWTGAASFLAAYRSQKELRDAVAVLRQVPPRVALASYAPAGGDGGAWRHDPFFHLAARNAGKDWEVAVLDSFQASSPGFPVVFRADADPGPFLQPVSQQARQLDIGPYEEATGRRIGAVYVRALPGWTGWGGTGWHRVAGEGGSALWLRGQ